MEQQKLFGKRVRAVRKAARISQEDTAEKASLNPKYLGEIERGEKRPSFEAIIALASALNTSPATFFDFDREENNERVLRKRIDTMIQNSRPEQLADIYRILKALLKP